MERMSHSYFLKGHGYLGIFAEYFSNKESLVLLEFAEAVFRQAKLSIFKHFDHENYNLSMAGAFFHVYDTNE
jgi:hypothetical protein